MAKRRKKNEIGVQARLFELHGKDEKKIIAAAERLRKADKQRIKAKEQVDVEKQNLRELVENAGLQPTDDGKIKFKCGGYIIEVTPKEDGVKVKGENEEQKNV